MPLKLSDLPPPMPLKMVRVVAPLTTKSLPNPRLLAPAKEVVPVMRNALGRTRSALAWIVGEFPTLVNVPVPSALA